MRKTRVKNIPSPILGYYTPPGTNQTIRNPLYGKPSWIEDCSVITFNHPQWWKSRNGGGEFLSSGFTSSASYSNPIRCGYHGSNTIGRYNGRYAGQLSVNTPGGGPVAAKADPMAWGAAAYNKMRPDKPKFDSLNAIFELRDIPAMLKKQLEPFKDVVRSSKLYGDKFLEFQFGWAPLIRDAYNLVRAQIEMQKSLHQLLRDNGRPVRRKVVLFNDTSETTTTVGNAYGQIFTSSQFSSNYYLMDNNYHRLYKRDYIHKRVWASARFRYWLPPAMGDVHYNRRMMRALMGLYISPRMLYNALPWTWLADWFTSVGDVVSNLSVEIADRVAADYFYIMCEDARTHHFVGHGTFVESLDNNVKVYHLAQGSHTNIAFNRARYVGDPFGFATKENQLSGTQLAILGALGISRL